MDPNVLFGSQVCATTPLDDRCGAFLDFAVDRARKMDGAPRILEVQTRAWDFSAGAEDADYCDSMTTLALDVNARKVTEHRGAPCDALDLRACCASTLGTI